MVFSPSIPKWDNRIIPIWYYIVKGGFPIFRLKELRKRKKLSQVRVAMDLNMNQNSISRYENGEREADYNTLIAFADYYDVSVDYLLGRTDNPKVNR